MKKISGIMIILIICLSIASILPYRVEAFPGTHYISQDDFEEYKTGSFPSSWKIAYSGAGASEQFVSNKYSYSGSKSLRLLGSYGWSAVVERKFKAISDLIGYDVHVLVTAYGNREANAKIGFWHQSAGGKRWHGDAFYVWVWFTYEGYIITQNDTHFIKIGTYSLGVWYDIKAVYDQLNRKYWLWINGNYIGIFKVNKELDPGEPNAINLQSGWASVPVYFDNVKVFEVSQAPVTPALIPFHGTVYIHADGSIDPQNAPLKTTDKIHYILIGNITSDGNGIVIKRNNIILDGNGYTVKGSLKGGYVGIDLRGTGWYPNTRENVTIKHLKITNFYYGIALNRYSWDNFIIENYIMNNKYGVMITTYRCLPTHNHFYHNNFVDNIYQVRYQFLALSLSPYPGGDVWDNGYPSGGNYWSDYKGNDIYKGPYQNESGSDGIGDTSYVIAHGMSGTCVIWHGKCYYCEEEDHYPLMKPFTFSITASHHKVKISNIFAPLSVRTSQDFHIAVSVSYNFSSNTNISVGIWNYSNSEKLASINDVVSGCDFKIYDFELKSPASTGMLELMVSASYFEGGEEKVGDKQLLRIPVVEGEVSYSAFKITGSFFNVSYNGKWYRAFYMYNVTWQASPDYSNVEAFYKWRFSHYNWLVLNSSGDLVDNIDDYVRIAFAAQTALVGIEDYTNVVDKGDLFKELSGYAIAAETCREIGSIASGMVGGIVLSYVTPSFTIKFFAQSLVNGIEKGITDPGELIKYVAIEDLISSSSNLYKATDIIKPVYEDFMSKRYGYPYAFLGVHVDYENMIQYYTYKKNGFVIGLSSMHTLSKIYEEGVGSYLKSIAQSLVDSSLTGTKLVAYAEKLITETPELKGFLSDLAKEENRYNIMNSTFFEVTKQIASSLKRGKLFGLKKTTSSGKYIVNASVLINVVVEKNGAGKPEIDVEKYTSNPGGKTQFKPVKFIDVKLNDSSNLDYIFLKVYYTDSEISGLNESSLRLYWWDGSEWIQCSNTGVNETGNYVWANITSTSIPALSQLTGTIFSSGEPMPSPKPKPYVKVKIYKPTVLNVNYTVVNNTVIFNITAFTEDGKPLNGTIELWTWEKIDTSLGKMYVFTYTEKYSVVNGTITIKYPLHNGLNGFLIEFSPENPDYTLLFYEGGREPIWIEN